MQGPTAFGFGPPRFVPKDNLQPATKRKQGAVREKKISWVHNDVSMKGELSVIIASMQSLMTERVTAAAAAVAFESADAASSPSTFHSAITRAAIIVDTCCTCLPQPGRYEHEQGCAAAKRHMISNAAAEDAVQEMQDIADCLGFLDYVPTIGTQWLPWAIEIYMRVYNSLPNTSAASGYGQCDPITSAGANGSIERGGATMSRHTQETRRQIHAQTAHSPGTGSNPYSFKSHGQSHGRVLSRSTGPGSRGGASMCVTRRYWKAQDQLPNAVDSGSSYEDGQDAQSDDAASSSGELSSREVHFPTIWGPSMSRPHSLGSMFLEVFGQYSDDNTRMRNPEHVFASDNSIMFCLPTLKVLEAWQATAPSVVRDDHHVSFLYLYVQEHGGDDKDQAKEPSLKVACSLHTSCGNGMPRELPTNVAMMHDKACDTMCECAETFIRYVAPTHSSVTPNPVTIIKQLMKTSQPWKIHKDGEPAHTVRKPATSWPIIQVIVLTLVSDCLANSSIWYCRQIRSKYCELTCFFKIILW